MISPFGVDHGGFSKSFVPGKGYKAANKLDDIERHIVRNKAAGNSAAMRSGNRPAKPSSKGRTMWDVPLQRGKLTKVIASHHQTGANPMSGLQGFSRFDGRGGGQIVIHDSAKDFKATAKHEMAHVAPRRNPVRLQERLKDPATKGREEGRADYIGNGKPTPGQYPGSHEFQHGYNQVQAKMVRAKGRKKP